MSTSLFPFQEANFTLEAPAESASTAASGASSIDLVLNPEGFIRDASPSVETLGYAPEGLVGDLLFHYISEGDMLPAFRSIVDLVLRSKPQAQFPVRVRTAAGAWQAFCAEGRAQRDDHAVVGVLLTLHPLLGAL